MPIKKTLLKYLYRYSPGLRKVADDRAAFHAELEATRAHLHDLTQKLSAREVDIEALNANIDALGANIAALNSVQHEINQSLIEKDAKIECLTREQRELVKGLVKAKATIEFLFQQERERGSPLYSQEEVEALQGDSSESGELSEAERKKLLDDSLLRESIEATSEKFILQQNVKTLEASRDILSGRVAELIVQVKRVGNFNFIEEALKPKVSSAPVAAPTESKRRAKFAVFSNPRSGSTWLETMLGLLPDVYVDYELKWGVTYTPGDIHAVIGEDTKSISQLLENMDTAAPVTGSKFVFDILGLTPIDFKILTGKIGSDVRIIHLTRNYRDIFLSIRRGYHHAPVRTEALTGRLRTALESADIRHALKGPASYVHPLICVNEMSRLLDNDIYIHSLKAAGFPYLRVSYDAVPARLKEIANFVGCDAAPKTIADLLLRPAVAKLPAFDGNEILSNLAELEPIFESFKVLQQRVITG